MKRSIERWTSMVPEAVAQGSTTQASYCIADAQHDIIELFRENKEAADQECAETRPPSQPYRWRTNGLPGN
jgi:hypothetical protein